MVRRPMGNKHKKYKKSMIMSFEASKLCTYNANMADMAASLGYDKLYHMVQGQC